MVLEHVLSPRFLEKRFWSSVIVGVAFSLIGIILARLLFGANSGLASVIFTSILLTPTLTKLFRAEEHLEMHERKFTLQHLYRDNKDIIKLYMGIFIGVFGAYLAFSSLSMYFGLDIYSIFKEQVFLDSAMTGRAAFDGGVFWSILGNNWWILLACFVLSLMAGNGAIFFVVWNASAWGVLFGVRAVASALFLGDNVLVKLGVLLLNVLPHTLIEGGAYVLAGIAGAVISKGVISRSSDMKRFLSLFSASLFAYYLLNLFLTFVLGEGIAIIIARMLIIFTSLHILRFAFTDKQHHEVYVYNYWLFAIAIAVFVIGAFLETIVLSNSRSLIDIYITASLYFM